MGKDAARLYVMCIVQYNIITVVCWTMCAEDNERREGGKRGAFVRGSIAVCHAISQLKS